MSIRYRDKNGAERVISGLTPGGDLAMGANTTRSGTISCEASSTQSYCQKNIAFTEPMPDNDYIIEIQPASGDWEVEQWTCVNKTASGFTFVVHNINHTAPFVATNFYYNAFKLYEVSQADQNASDITDIKAKIPSTASSSNKLATSKDVSDLSSAVDERLDGLEDAVPVDASITNQLVSTSTMNTALGGKQDTLEFDDTPTAGSDNPVTSDGIKDALDDVGADIDNATADIYEVIGKNGAKNLLPNITVSKSISGITYTRNSNGSVTINGTSTGWGQNDVGKCLLPKGTYTISVGVTVPSGVFFTLRNDDADSSILNLGNGGTETKRDFTLASDTNVRLYCGISGNVTVSNITFYPMVYLSSDTDTTYQPYALTNQQITPYVQAISNPNLLDNPWFTINQRGRTTYPNSMNGFSVDRWYKNLNINLDVINNGVRLTKKATSNPTLYQKIEASPYLLGKTVTLSVMTTDGKIRSCTGTFPSTFPSSGNVIVVNFDDDIISFRLQAVSTFNPYFIATLDTENCAIDEYLDIRAVKLELGTVSTLAMDTAPNYQQELAKCQRYFVRIGGTTSGYPIALGRAHNATQGRYLIHLPVPMRSSAVVTCSDFTKVRELCNHQQCTPTSFSAGTMDAGGYLSLYTTTTGLVTDELCGLLLQAEYLDISADL